MSQCTEHLVTGVYPYKKATFYLLVFPDPCQIVVEKKPCHRRGQCNYYFDYYDRSEGTACTLYFSDEFPLLACPKVLNGGMGLTPYWFCLPANELSMRNTDHREGNTGRKGAIEVIIVSDVI